MFCKNCGKEISVTDKFCNNCGAVINEAPVENTEQVPFSGTQVGESYPTQEPMGVNTESPVAPVEPATAPVETPVAPVEPIIQTGVQEPVPPVALDIPNTPVNEQPISQPQSTIVSGESIIKPIEPSPVITEPVIDTTPKSETKSNNKLFIIIIIILGVVIIGAGAFVAYKVFGGRPDTPVVDTPETPKVEETSTYTFKGYKFTIPTGFTKKVNGTQDVLSGSGVYFGAFDIDSTITYDYLKNEFATVAQTSIDSWASGGFAFVEYGEATVAGSNFLYIQYYNQVQNLYADVAITKLPDGTLLRAELYYKKEDDATSGYTGLGSFARSAVKDTTSTTTGSFSDTYTSFGNIDISKIELE